MEEYKIKVQKTARYFTSGSLNNETKSVWFVCHGYRQLASNFIRSFQLLADDGHFIVAPEGFHRFYIDGYTGKIGASWMTAEDRTSDIKDYLSFLMNIFEHYKAEIATRQLKINILGFSQGAATVSRWLNKSGMRCDNLILWAGVYPKDLEKDENFVVLDSVKNFLVVGDEDQFVSEEKLLEYKKEIDAVGIEYQLVRFAGKHVVNPETVLQFAREHLHQ